MAQYLKEDVQCRISQAALRIFARDGFTKARITDIAEDAQVSTGNIYRYFETKEVLFEAVVPQSFYKELLRKSRNNDAILGMLHKDPRRKQESVAATNELISFWIEKRLETVILLKGAQGSRYEGFTESYVDELIAKTHQLLHETNRSNREDLLPHDLFVLRLIYRGILRKFVEVLEAFDNEEAIRKAIASLWTYHTAGLLELWAQENENTRSR